jgi:hypothetical protein
MRSLLVAVALGLAAVGLTTLTPAAAHAQPPRVVVGVTAPGVSVTYGSFYTPVYVPPPPVVVTYATPVAPVAVVTPPPAVVVTPAPPVVVVRPRYHYHHRHW